MNSFRNDSGLSLEGNGEDDGTFATKGYAVPNATATEFLVVLGDCIFVVSNPIITIVSVVCNALTLMIMSQRSLRRTSVAVYLSALAASDSLVLILDIFNNWFRTVLKIYLLGISGPFCKFHRFFFRVAYTYSAWLVTSVSVERFIVVWFPLRAKTVCSYRNTVATVAAMPVPIAALYLTNLWAWGVDGSGECSISDDWLDFQSNAAAVISGIAYSFCPVVLLAFFTAAIGLRLSLARRRRRQMALEASTAEKKENRLTLTIVVICIFYVILTVPLSVFYILVFKYGEVGHTNRAKVQIPEYLKK